MAIKTISFITILPKRLFMSDKDDFDRSSPASLGRERAREKRKWLFEVKGIKIDMSQWLDLISEEVEKANEEIARKKRIKKQTEANEKN